MMNQNYYIWAEFEQWENSTVNPADCNSDVIVSFENGAEWAATFFTYANIFALAEKNKKTGECLNGKYFWASDMILVDEITRERIEEVVRHLIQVNEFEVVFKINKEV